MDQHNQPLTSHSTGLPISAQRYLVRQTIANRPASPYGFDTSYDSQDEGGLLEYWRLLRRYKAAIVLSSLGGAILGFVVALPLPRTYRAQTSLEVLNMNQDFLNMRGSNPLTTTASSDDSSEQQTEAKLLTSGTVLKRVIAKLSLIPQPVSAPKPQEAQGWESWLPFAKIDDQTKRRALLASAAKSVKVNITPRTRLMQLSVDSTDPKLAADFANTLAQEFIEQSVESRWQSTQKVNDWLRRELDDARNKLQQSENALQAYARGSGLLFTDDNTNVATEQLEQVQSQLSAARADRMSKQSRYQLAKTTRPDTLADVLNDSSLRATQSKIDDLRRQLADLNIVYSPQFSKVRRTQSQLESLQTTFNRDRADVLQRINNDYDESLSREKLLVQAYDQQKHEVNGQAERSIQYNILKRELESNRQLYDTMLQQLKQSSIASALRASNVRIVDLAEPSYLAVFPNFRLDAIMGFVAGLFSSVLVITIRHRADRTLQQPGDLNLWTDLPELGTIPSATAASKGLFYPRRAGTIAPRNGDGRRPAYERDRGRVELVTLQQRPSLMADAFRFTVTSLLFVGEDGKRPRVLVFTSSQSGEGKTTTVSNLGIALAEIHQKVLVIDGDLRGPRMHDVFDLPNEEGLTTFLREDFSQTRLDQLIQKTRMPGLDVLPSGPPTDAAGNLLHSPTMAKSLNSLRNRYDTILIDTPPTLQITDARVLGRLADAVVLVARANQTTRDAVMAVYKRMLHDRIPVIGTILNDWDPKASTGDYGYYNTSRYDRYHRDGSLHDLEQSHN